MSFVLCVHDDAGAVTSRVPIGGRALFVGRSEDNQVILPDPGVSGRHLSLRLLDGSVEIIDLGSSNGTSIDGVALSGVGTVHPGQKVVVGGARTLTVEPHTITSATVPRWLLRDHRTGVAHAVDRERFWLGPDEDAALLVSGSERLLLLLDPDGRLYRGVDDEQVPLGEGETLSLGDRSFTVERAADRIAATVMIERHAYPYVVHLHSDPGAESVSVANDGVRCTVTAPNRVALLMVLARRLQADRADNAPPDHAGWCADQDIAIGMWGRAGRSRPVKVELCRLRAELRKAGLDGWCIEKRGTATRLRAQEIVSV